MTILASPDAIKRISFPIVENVDMFENWSTFISMTNSAIDGIDVVLAFKEFLFILKNGSKRPILGDSGLNDNVSRFYSQILTYFVDETKKDEKSDYLTTLYELNENYSDVMSMYESLPKADLFIIANIFAMYYLSRQLAQSYGFISDNRNNLNRFYYSNTPNYCQTPSDAYKVFLSPNDEYMQGARIYNRFYGIETVDNRNLFESRTHIIYEFFEKLIVNPDATTNNVICFDLDENGKYKKEDVISFCKLFNPNMRISHYFQNNGSNLLTSIKILVRKNIKNAKETIVEKIALKYMERIQEIKNEVISRYVLLFYRAFTNNGTITCPRYTTQCVYGADVNKSFLGLNFFGSFFYNFNINYETKVISNKCSYVFNNVSKGQSLYLYVLGYDITDWETSKIQVSFNLNETMYHIEFEGNVVTTYGIRPILKAQSTIANSYYTSPLIYSGSIEKDTSEIVISLEDVLPKDNRIVFYDCKSHNQIAVFERDKVKMSFVQPIREIKLTFSTQKATLWGLFFVL